MRSKASIKSHPLHPMLIAFPAGLLPAGFLFDLLAVFTGNDELWRVGYYLQIAGIIGGLLAAVPGIIDYFGTVPPKSSARKRGAMHGLINVTHLALFFTAWQLKRQADYSETFVLGLETLAVSLLAWAGWLGGTLVYRNQIAVDTRYANTGKWKEAWFEPAAEIEVAAADELEINHMKLLHIGSKRVVLGRTETGFVAFDDHCTHRGGSLAGGVMICGTVQCPWHGSQFNTATGAVAAGPAKEAIATYTVRESAGKVYLRYN